jgi:glycerate kinase
MSTNLRNLKIAVAPDGFKGSLTALQAATCIERGLKQALRGVTVIKIPMADGGGGTARTVAAATGGRMVTRRVTDPLGRPIRASFALTGDGRQAVIEMAEASGLTLLQPRERNPLRTSTRGTGELIRAALDLGVSRITVGLGGSATNDGGTGIARALGVRFLDRQGNDIGEGGGALARLQRLDVSGLERRLRGVAIEAACDVRNPLCGPQGAARVFGPQKGATPAMARELDRALDRLARVIKRDLGQDVRDTPGAGAAGGTGAGLLAFLNARLRPGVELVAEAVGLEQRMRGCNLVITGEGRLDGQTVFGKTVSGVARVAGKLGIPVVALCGSIGKDAHRVHAIGIDAYFSALQEPLDEALLPARAPAMLETCAEQLGRLLALRLM